MRSAGSFIPQHRYRYYVNDDRSAIRSGGFTQKGQHFEVLVGGGYYYTLVLQKNFYASLGLTPNCGYLPSRIATHYTSNTETATQNNFMIRAEGRGGAVTTATVSSQAFT